MARADQLKALLRSHLEGNDEQFYSVAMQVAASEARQGHGKLASELRDLIDKAKARPGVGRGAKSGAIPISRPRGEIANLLAVSYPKIRLTQMVLRLDLAVQLERVVREQRRASDILAHGLSPRRKILLMGPPGTGKTMTASVLAGELGLPLFQVRLDGLITKFMGETAAKLRQIFDATDKTRGVYFFDEFDAIGSQRGLANDVGEIRRVLNSFLHMIEQDDSHSLIVAATNHPEILDQALFRRFDDVLHYELPTDQEIAKILKSHLAAVSEKGTSWQELAKASGGLSFAEVVRAADETRKEALIEHRERVTQSDILRTLDERRRISERVNRRSA